MLSLVGAERPGNPYRDPAVAIPVARRIAGLASPHFLIAGLDARRRGMYDPATLTLTATVDSALDALPGPGIAGRRAPRPAVLAALAHAEAPG
ncbi:hypothetical protein OHA72_27150 [Dactylosporangium sp. NBC_01737]|uniref:hypothetical protein n=1 Tax=Dactylosporangium sp. NBC_01737 TaxID=2975959 RepID=UPI002E10E5BD|nr:hypothetical protein OHA72_27150 [Dactylosporangium sp. NBC_01737]